jgi:hypothetical protein
LVNRLDSRLDQLVSSSNIERPSAITESPSSAELDPAPVFLIRDAATDAGVHSPEQTNTHAGSQSDVISSGLVSLSTAHSLLKLYVHSSGKGDQAADNFPDSTYTMADGFDFQKTSL